MKNLTDTELMVSELVSKGLTNKEIAGKLNISRHTVKAHLENIYLKLEINNRVVLAIMYYKYETC